MTTPPTGECPIQAVFAYDYLKCSFLPGHAGRHSWEIPTPGGIPTLCLDCDQPMSAHPAGHGCPDLDDYEMPAGLTEGLDYEVSQ
jgi:hypothetical protein